MSSHFVRLTLASIMMLGWTPAHAYIDPGTGSMLIQGLIAVIAAAGITAKIYWQQLKDFMGFNKDKDVQPAEEDPDAQP